MGFTTSFDQTVFTFHYCHQVSLAASGLPQASLLHVMFSWALVVWVMWIMHGEVAPPVPACAEKAHVLDTRKYELPSYHPFFL